MQTFQANYLIIYKEINKLIKATNSIKENLLVALYIYKAKMIDIYIKEKYTYNLQKYRHL